MSDASTTTQTTPLPLEEDARRAGEGDAASSCGPLTAATLPLIRPAGPLLAARAEASKLSSRKGRRVFVGVFCCVATFCSLASAKETLVKDVAEFDAAVKAAQAGDHIILGNGGWRDVDLKFRGSGTKDAPITLRAQTPGDVALLGSSRLRFGGEYLIARDLLWLDSAAADDVVSFRIDSKTLASHCSLLHSAIIGDDPEMERKFVSLYGEHNDVRSCRFEGKRSKGTLLVVWLGEGAAPNHHTIFDNFFGPRERLGKNGGEIIRVGDSKTSLQSSETVVGFNYFYRCDGEAEIISNKSCDNSYGSNVFVGCSGAVTMRHGNRCFVLRNYFYGDGCKGTGGVRVIGERHTIRENHFYGLLGDDTRAAISIMNGVPHSPANAYVRVVGAVVENNSFVDCKQNICVGLSDDDQQEQILPPKLCRFAKNVVVGKSPVFAIRTPAIESKYESNFYHGGPLGIDAVDGWIQATEVPRYDIANHFWPIELGGKLTLIPPDVMSDFVCPVKLAVIGPAWMRPGDEFLPKVLQAAKKTDATPK